jgi:hypothetical protein
MHRAHSAHNRCCFARALIFAHLASSAGRALLLSTADDASPSGPSVRLANFGFSLVGDGSARANASPEDLAASARADCRALGLALAELLFGALSLEGPGPRTSAEALQRVFFDIFSRDWGAIASFCAEEAAWAPPCALLSARNGAGWALLAALLDDETYSADAERVLSAAAELLEAVRVE